MDFHADHLRTPACARLVGGLHHARGLRQRDLGDRQPALPDGRRRQRAARFRTRLPRHPAHHARDGLHLRQTRRSRSSLHCCGGPSERADLRPGAVRGRTSRPASVVWGWDPLQHVPLRESYAGVPDHGPWDPYHFNSICFGPSGAPIVSARNTWAAYWIDRRSAQRLRHARRQALDASSSLGGARFAWQHDVRAAARQPGEPVRRRGRAAGGRSSRAVSCWRSTGQHHSASVAHEYVLPKPALAGSQGDVEPLPNGNVFVGWGQLPYFTEYSAGGALLYLGNLPGPDESYRAFRAPWVGCRANRPRSRSCPRRARATSTRAGTAPPRWPRGSCSPGRAPPRSPPTRRPRGARRLRDRARRPPTPAPTTPCRRSTPRATCSRLPRHAPAAAEHEHHAQVIPRSGAPGPARAMGHAGGYASRR